MASLVLRLPAGPVRPGGRAPRRLRAFNASDIPDASLRVKLPEDEAEVRAVMDGKGDLAFSVAFEVIPDFDIKDHSGLELVRHVVEVSEDQIAETLKRISKQYQTGEALPDELIRKLIASRNIDAGLVQLRQLFFSKFDVLIHTTELTNTTALYERLQKEIQMVPMTPGCHPQASFGHLMGGYDSGYYGYLWARVISSDLFSAFEDKGVFSPEVGMNYRDTILAAGRVADDAAVVEKFLGRPFNEDAFIKSLGLTQDQEVAATTAAPGSECSAQQPAPAAAAVKSYRERAQEAFQKIYDR